MNLVKLFDMRFRTENSRSKSKYGLLECDTCGARKVGFAPTRKTRMCRNCSGRDKATHRETKSRLTLMSARDDFAEQCVLLIGLRAQSNMYGVPVFD